MSAISTLLSYVGKLLQNLWWAAGAISVIPFILGPFASKVQRNIPLFPDTWGGAFLLALTFGVIASSFRMYSQLTSRVEELEVLNARLRTEAAERNSPPEFAAIINRTVNGKPVKVSLTRIIQPNLNLLQGAVSNFWWGKYEKAVEKERQNRSPWVNVSSSYVLKDDIFKSNLAKMLSQVESYSSDYKHHLWVTQNNLKVFLTVENTGNIPASNVVMNLIVPSGCRVATDLEKDWIEGEMLTPPGPPEMFGGSLHYSLSAFPKFEYEFSDATRQPFTNGLNVSNRNDGQVVGFAVGAMSPSEIRDNLQPFYLIIDDIKGALGPIRIQITATELREPIEFSQVLSTSIVKSIDSINREILRKIIAAASDT